MLSSEEEEGEEEEEEFGDANDDFDLTAIINNPSTKKRINAYDYIAPTAEKQVERVNAYDDFNAGSNLNSVARAFTPSSSTTTSTSNNNYNNNTPPQPKDCKTTAITTEEEK